MAKIIELIHVGVTKGDGKNDPFRIVEQYWTKQGILLFEKDPVESQLTKVDKSKLENDERENDARFREICY